ncbi:MAG: hypothetical protein FWE15_32410, partial [Actinomycetia bacterium]|nr:hypothetical protein [Actinomycetes bacterium]
MPASTVEVIATGSTEPDEWPAAAVGSASCVTGAEDAPDVADAGDVDLEGDGVADVGHGKRRRLAEALRDAHHRLPHEHAHPDADTDRV